MLDFINIKSTKLTMSSRRVRINFPVSVSEHQKVLKKLGGGERLASAQISELLEQPRYKDVIKTALQRHAQGEELKQYQSELIKLQDHMERTGRKLIILFDGRDASGKGGTIRRVTRYMNSKHYRVVALGKPTEDQQTEMHMKRYIEQFPRAGEIVLFDRSWYNRAMVEPVMGFCTKEQYRQFMETVVTFERSFLEDNSTILIKMYFSVSKQEQARRFEIRKRDPLRQWKLSEVDLQAQELWDKFTEKKYQLLLKTHKPDVPWYVLRSDDKHHARIEAMKLILRSCPYRGRSRSLDFSPNKKVVINGDQELRTMREQKRRHGKFQG
jgi:polyphosphate kinase 2